MGFEYIPVKDPCHDHYSDMEAGNTHKMGIEPVYHSETFVSIVVRSVGCGHSKGIDVIGGFVAIPQFLKDFYSYFCAFFSAEFCYAERKGSCKRLDKVKVYGDVFWGKGNCPVQDVIHIDNRYFFKLQLYAELRDEEFFQCGEYTSKKRPYGFSVEYKKKIGF